MEMLIDIILFTIFVKSPSLLAPLLGGIYTNNADFALMAKCTVLNTSLDMSTSRLRFCAIYFDNAGHFV